MKSFSKFLIEATQSQASMQAKKLNLKSDGHGGWLDTKGEFVAKTEKGKQVFYDKGRVEGGKDQPGSTAGSTQQQKNHQQNQSRHQHLKHHQKQQNQKKVKLVLIH